jgi:hypothetical protein
MLLWFQRMRDSSGNPFYSGVPIFRDSRIKRLQRIARPEVAEAIAGATEGTCPKKSLNSRTKACCFIFLASYRCDDRDSPKDTKHHRGRD